MSRKITLSGLSEILETINGKFLQISRNDEDNYISPFRQLHSFICRENNKEILVLEDDGVEEEYSNTRRFKENDISKIEIIDENRYGNELLAISIIVTFVSGKVLQIIF